MVVKEFIEDIDDEDWQDRFSEIWKWTKRTFWGALAISAIYQSFNYVPPDSEGVVKRLGAYNRTVERGLKFKIPFIETMDKVPVRKIHTSEFGIRTLESGVDSDFLTIDNIEKGNVKEKDLEILLKSSGVNYEEMDFNEKKEKSRIIMKGEYLMLTGDLNMANVQWTVQWKIKNSKDYLFNIRNPKATIYDASLAVNKKIIGNGSVDEVISISRIAYEVQANNELQELLDDYQSGIQIVNVNMQESKPPRKVQPSFDEVNSSIAMKEEMINEANGEYNKVVPNARGRAKGMIEKAHGYAVKRINEAKGDVDRFSQVLSEYKKAPDITRDRMYLEKMTEVLFNLGELNIVEQKGAEGGVWMRMDLK